MSGLKFIKQKVDQIGSNYDFTFSYAPVCNDVNVALETSEPTSYTFDFTINETFYNSQITGRAHPKFISLYLILGSSTTGTTYYNIYKNDNLVYSGNKAYTSVQQSTCCYPISEVKIGDRISAKIWTTTSGTFTYNAYVLAPIEIAPINFLLKDFKTYVSSNYISITLTSSQDTLVKSNLAGMIPPQVNLPANDAKDIGANSNKLGKTLTMPYLLPNSTWKFTSTLPAYLIRDGYTYGIGYYNIYCAINRISFRTLPNVRR